MLFLIHGGDEPLVGASYTDADCVTVEVPPDEVEVIATGQWASPHSDCTYPMGWQIRVGELELVVEGVE